MRVAKIVAKKVAIPVYVSSSISFASVGQGGTVEEEMEGIRRCMEVILPEVEKTRHFLTGGVRL